MISHILPRLFSALLILTISAITFSCGEDDPTASENLEGTWDATSFVLAGTETIGVTNESFELNFSSNGDNTGTYQGTTTDINGTPNTTAFTYEILDNGNRLLLGSDTLEMNVSESNLRLDGTFQGSTYLVLANQ